MNPTIKHNLLNVVLIFLPTLLVYVIYYSGGGTFERNPVLGFTTCTGFMFSLITAAVLTEYRGWK